MGFWSWHVISGRLFNLYNKIINLLEVKCHVERRGFSVIFHFGNWDFELLCRLLTVALNKDDLKFFGD